MNLSIRVCDFCDTCVFAGEYEIINNEIVCIMCIDEQEERELEDEIPSRSVGAV